MNEGIILIGPDDFRAEVGYSDKKLSTIMNQFRALMYDNEANSRLQTGEPFHTSYQGGHYNRWRFSLEFFLENNLFTLVGETSKVPECYYKPPLHFGREAEAIDPGYATLIVEGHKTLLKDSYTLSEAIGLVVPKYLEAQLKKVE